MISKADIRALELDGEHISDYFYYIISSELNGQRAQVRSLIKALSVAQKKEALQYFEDNQENNNSARICKQLLIESL